tara:strand:+ start:92 stop:619 length:528 start_codon:yes stop_codon:yes gene_type:complete
MVYFPRVLWTNILGYCGDPMTLQKERMDLCIALINHLSVLRDYTTLGSRTQHLLFGCIEPEEFNGGFRVKDLIFEPPKSPTTGITFDYLGGTAWHFCSSPYLKVWEAFSHPGIPGGNYTLAEWFDNAGDPKQRGYCQPNWLNSIAIREHKNMHMWARKGVRRWNRYGYHICMSQD